MKRKSRKEWLEQDCVFTRSCKCDACPLVIFDENGSRKCETALYDVCTNRKSFEESES